MLEFTLRERAIPLNDEFEVIVVGGGPSGCAAAAAAAREGARTLLIEATGCLGGMGTSGMVPCWCPFSDQEKIIYRGIAQKVFEAAKAPMAHVPAAQTDWVPINSEALKRIYDALVTEAGAEVLFQTMLSSVEHNAEGRVTEILVTNKRGLTAYRAPVFIDCTGDADLAAWAGADYVKGDEKTGEMQAATLCFLMTNVDEYGYWNGPQLWAGDPNSPIYPILESGRFPLIIDQHFGATMVGPKAYGFNSGHVYDVDSTDPQNVSKALIQGRKIAEQFRQALAEFHPRAFANAYLTATAPALGVRESRRIHGDYTLTVEDYMARRSFPDEICRNSYYIDIHAKLSEKERTERINFDQVQAEFAPYQKGDSHGIPYRCLIPQGLKNVLVAGRSISCERSVQASVRVMPVCLCMGEAAGIAGALAARLGGEVRGVAPETLRERLRAEGAYLP